MANDETTMSNTMDHLTEFQKVSDKKEGSISYEDALCMVRDYYKELYSDGSKESDQAFEETIDNIQILDIAYSEDHAYLYASRLVDGTCDTIQYLTKKEDGSYEVTKQKITEETGNPKKPSLKSWKAESEPVYYIEFIGEQERYRTENNGRFLDKMQITFDDGSEEELSICTKNGICFSSDKKVKDWKIVDEDGKMQLQKAAEK